MEEKRYYDINELHMFLQRAKAVKYMYLMKKVKLVAGSDNQQRDEVIFEERGFSLVDRYCFSEPFSGQELIRFQSRPVWMMNYFGESAEKTGNVRNEQILELVKLSVLTTYQVGGINGSIIYQKNGYRYLVENMTESSMYNGKGYIYFGEELIYRYTYYGGIVSD